MMNEKPSDMAALTKQWNLASGNDNDSKTAPSAVESSGRRSAFTDVASADFIDDEPPGTLILTKSQGGEYLPTVSLIDPESRRSVEFTPTFTGLIEVADHSYGDAPQDPVDEEEPPVERMTMSVQSLAIETIAKEVFGMPELAPLLATMNADKTFQKLSDNSENPYERPRLIVVMDKNQDITLPTWQDIMLFQERYAQLPYLPEVVTVLI